jgi:hypothetical protein
MVATATNYVLVDFENVQPRNLELLDSHPCKVLVFVGANQTRIPLGLATALQSFGDAGRYISVSGTGKDALDFHIAYYVGELVASEPEAYFHIISRDKGFDPLVKHLRSRRFRVSRDPDLAEIPLLRLSSAGSHDEKIAAIVENLKGRGQSRPRKVATLANTINSLFKEDISESDLGALIEEMRRRGLISVDAGKVGYKLTDLRS